MMVTFKCAKCKQIKIDPPEEFFEKCDLKKCLCPECNYHLERA